MYKTLKD